MSDLLDRLADKFTVGDGCWEWTAATASGYGVVKRDGRNVGAHRVLYELFVGPIPTGLQVDHVCRNRLCVRPSHLEAVTAAENMLRLGALKTHCPLGHPYSEENTYRRSSGARICRTCKRTRWDK